MKLLKWLGWCEHDWKEVAQYGVYVLGNQTATEYHQRCSKCGKMRKITL